MKPLVSISCITYNHENYIADALDGFLMQKTNFEYEILIHDDASTDNTPKIIKKYCQQYPEIIKPIYQHDNQYSKGVKILRTYQYPRALGDYIAMCEGDDYWTDPLKLQKQVDFMEQNKEYICVFHAVSVVDTSKKILGSYLGLYGGGDKDCTMAEAGTGGVMHISSLLFKKELVMQEFPDWAKNARHGDYALAVMLRAAGKVYYMDKCMSSYREGVPNSMMTTLRNNRTKESEIQYHLQRITTMDEANRYYGYKFHDDFLKINLVSKVCIRIISGDIGKQARKDYKVYWKQYGLVGLAKQYLLTRHPALASKLVRLKAKSF